MSAENRSVAAFSAQSVIQVGNAVVVPLGSVEAARGNNHGSLAAHIVARRMPSAFRFRAHEREGHRKLTVDEGFQLTGQSKVIQGETPNNNVGPQDFIDNSLHIVVDAALPWRLVPTRKAAQAGFEVKRADVKGFDFRGLGTAIFFLDGNTFKKSAG